MFQISQAVLFHFFSLRGGFVGLWRRVPALRATKILEFQRSKASLACSNPPRDRSTATATHFELLYSISKATRQGSIQMNRTFGSTSMWLRIRNVESRICTSIEGQSLKSISNATSGSIQLCSFLKWQCCLFLFHHFVGVFNRVGFCPRSWDARATS